MKSYLSCFPAIQVCKFYEKCLFISDNLHVGIYRYSLMHFMFKNILDILLKEFMINSTTTTNNLLFLAHSNVAPNFCVEPWVVNMGLYGNYDIALGGFLESFCFNSEYLCPNQQCNTPILNHTRRFCHSGGAVSVHMQVHIMFI